MTSCSCCNKNHWFPGQQLKEREKRDEEEGLELHRWGHPWLWFTLGLSPMPCCCQCFCYELCKRVLPHWDNPMWLCLLLAFYYLIQTKPWLMGGTALSVLLLTLLLNPIRKGDCSAWRWEVSMQPWKLGMFVLLYKLGQRPISLPLLPTECAGFCMAVAFS